MLLNDDRQLIKTIIAKGERKIKKSLKDENLQQRIPNLKTFYIHQKIQSFDMVILSKNKPHSFKNGPFPSVDAHNEPRPKGICPSSSSSCNISQMLNSSDDINLIPKRVPKLYTLYRPHYIELVNRSRSRELILTRPQSSLFSDKSAVNGSAMDDVKVERGVRVSVN